VDNPGRRWRQTTPVAVRTVKPASVVTQSGLSKLLELIAALSTAEVLFCQAQLWADSEEEASIKISILFIIIKIIQKSSNTLSS
jgi:hypothetical protein